MFRQTFIETRDGKRKEFTLLASFALETLLVAVLILVPIVYSRALPAIELRTELLAPAPPPPHSTPTAARAAARAPRRFAVQLLTPRVPQRINNPEQAVAPPDVAGLEIPGTPTGVEGSTLGAVFERTTEPTPPPAPTPPKSQSTSKRVRVGGKVAEANLIHEVQPLYPALARSVRVQGRVEFLAVIGKDGTVQNLQLVQGHPLLVNAAREAVLQWRYRPTLLNGEPVEVVTNITVNFMLSP